MRKLFLFMTAGFTLIIAGASAQAAELGVAFGGSVPKDPSGKTFVQKAGPSRATGGERFTLRLSSPKTVTSVRLTGHSSGRAGKTLVRSATAFNGAAATPLEGLYQFSKVTLGKPQNQNGLVMLPDQAFVEVVPNQAFTRIEIQVEGYTNNDASLLLQVSFAEDLIPEEFLLTRTANGETSGSYVNESGYAKFTGAQLASLMRVGQRPAPEELAGKSYSCSSYFKLDPPKLDAKVRAYELDASGALVSSSSSEAPGAVWAVAPEGLKLTIANQNGCGRYETYNVLRRTPDGNLISEVVLDLDAYITLCAEAGYDTSATRELMQYSTFPSLLEERYVVGVYEFCRAR